MVASIRVDDWGSMPQSIRTPRTDVPTAFSPCPLTHGVRVAACFQRNSGENSHCGNYLVMRSYYMLLWLRVPKNQLLIVLDLICARRTTVFPVIRIFVTLVWD